MSWHSGDWANFTVTLMSAAAAVAAAIAAFQSGKSANEALNQQKNAFHFERNRHFMDLLKADAAKANTCVQNTKGIDWSFEQAANVTYAVDSAKQMIKDASSVISEVELDKLKEFFKDQLCYEIMSEMRQAKNMPDGFLHSHKGFRESREVIHLWIDNLRFFGFITVVESKQ
ncbi:hypothetical protein ACNY67_07005 [Pantoea sp. KXB45]|uniref:hypothetical protein n=1 Tax=Pantoea sp. KXB45 TaxID=3402309 RepID=UPI003AB184AE